MESLLLGRLLSVRRSGSGNSREIFPSFPRDFAIARMVAFLPPDTDMLSATDRPAPPLEIAIGQTLAGVRHPVAAWRTRPPFRRLVYLAACFTGSYVLILLVLQLLLA